MSVKEYYIEIHSDPNYLPEIEEFLQKIGTENNIEKTKQNNLVLAINEATTNGMMHGNKGNFEKKVKISISVSDSEIKSVIKDEGNGFNPKEVPDPTEPENLYKESGRGLYIMNTCMDVVNYNFTPKGTELFLVMKL
ncbi:MAG: ATP-binding protein [Ignavibacteriales bacterium]|nr:ATP-binding protein [Ignavibacteriales bacterium]